MVLTFLFLFSEQDQDSSLIRAFQPLQLNDPLSNSAMNPELNLKYIPNSRSPSKNNLSPDSGSFTLSVSSREVRILSNNEMQKMFNIRGNLNLDIIISKRIVSLI